MISTAVKPSLSLFCRGGFRGISDSIPGRGRFRLAPSFTHSTQGRLLCTQLSQHKGWVAPHCRFSICFVHRSLTTRGVRLCTRAGLHESRVGTSMPLEGALNPQVWYLATPPSSTHPKLGVRSRHQRLHSCALKGIFRPLLQGGRSD